LLHFSSVDLLIVTLVLAKRPSRKGKPYLLVLLSFQFQVSKGMVSFTSKSTRPFFLSIKPFLHLIDYITTKDNLKKSSLTFPDILNITYNLSIQDQGSTS